MIAAATTDTRPGNVAAFVDSLRFAPVDLGGLHDAGRLMQVGGGPLSGLHVVKLA